jgi:hypothetical protein
MEWSAAWQQGACSEEQCCMCMCCAALCSGCECACTLPIAQACECLLVCRVQRMKCCAVLTLPLCPQKRCMCIKPNLATGLQCVEQACTAPPVTRQQCSRHINLPYHHQHRAKFVPRQQGGESLGVLRRLRFDVARAPARVPLHSRFIRASSTARQ